MKIYSLVSSVITFFVGFASMAFAQTNFVGDVNAQYGSFVATNHVIAITGRVTAGTYIQAETFVKAPTVIFTGVLRSGGSTATGTYSVGLGAAATAASYSSVVLGRYNLTPSVTAESWVPTDPLFVVGNGADVSNPANALTILKDGTVSLGGAVVGTGVKSFAVGNGTQATSFVQTVVGQYNVLPSSPNATAWAAADPLFVIGNGTAAGTRSNAMTVLKNGAVLIKSSGDLSMGSYTTGPQP